MASGVGFSLIFNGEGIRGMAGKFAQAEEKFLFRINQRMEWGSERALAISQQYAPKGDGKFAAGLRAVQYSEMGFAITTDNPQLLMWLRNGTGIYAGHGMITAKAGQAMVFAGGRWPNAPISPNFGANFAFRSIRGMQANPWEMEALDAILGEITFSMQQAVIEFSGDLGEG